MLCFAARPGPLGNFLRVLPCCTREHFNQTPVELLPPATPVESRALVADAGGVECPGAWARDLGRDQRVLEGTRLQLGIVNFMCQVLPSKRNLDRGARGVCVARLEKYSKLAKTCKRPIL